MVNPLELDDANYNNKLNNFITTSFEYNNTLKLNNFRTKYTSFSQVTAKQKDSIANKQSDKKENNQQINKSDSENETEEDTTTTKQIMQIMTVAFQQMTKLIESIVVMYDAILALCTTESDPEKQKKV